MKWAEPLPPYPRWVVIATAITLAMVAARCASAEPTQQDIDELREQIRQLEAKAKGIKDASGDAEVKTNARAIERIMGVAKTLGVELDAQVSDEPVEPPVDPDPPVDPPTPGTGFTDLGEPDYELPATATIQQLQAALDQHDHVAIPAGREFTGSLTINRAKQVISVYGEGDRPVLRVPEGKHGIAVASERANVALQGLAILGPELPYLGSGNHGVHYKLGMNRSGSLDILIEDCEIARFDDLVFAVDDGSRKNGAAPPGHDGRITATLRRNILRDAWGSDSHSVGIYTEGVKLTTTEGNVVRRCGYTEDGSDPRDKRSHGHYGQQYGGQIVATDNWWIDCPGNAIQARLGATVTGNVAVRCGVGFTNNRAPDGTGDRSTYIGNLVLDQVDIAPDEPRGDAFPLNGSGHTIKDNLAVRKLGSAANRNAYRDYWNAAEFANNGAIDWIPGGDDSANWSLDEMPAGFPEFTDDKLDTLLTRRRGEWGPQYETDPFIQQARDAIAEVR